MSLLDFDDDGGTHTTTTTSFNGHTNIDDPFGFDVFGSGSTGNKHITNTETTTVFTSNANADSFFDDFDPLTNFNEPSNNQVRQVTVTTTTTTTSSSSHEPNQDHFDPFGDFNANTSGDVVQEASFKTTNSWEGDDFRTPGMNDADHVEEDDFHSVPRNEDTQQSWKREEMEEDRGFNQNQFNRKKQLEEPSEGDAGSDTFANDFLGRSRGRIDIEEIRQRSYEDVGPVSSASHSQNRKETKPAEKSPAVYVLGAAADNICKVCAKRVYEMEKVTADCQVYHKSCFRCNHCNRILSLGNFAANDGRLYCKPHFIEIFKTKGNYKDSFALAEQRKTRGDDETEEQEHYRGGAADEPRNQGYRRSSDVGYSDDDERDGETAKEEIPSVQIKSVRSTFEKMSQPTQQQQKQPSKFSGQTRTEYKRQEPVERVRSDSEKSDSDRERRIERKDSQGDREIVQSGTTCIVEDELPPPSFTKNVLAKFKMMESTSGSNKAPGKPVQSKQTVVPSSYQHQNLSYRSSAESRGSFDEESRSGRDVPDFSSRQTSEDQKREDQADEMPQVGLAKSLLAQWRNLEEQSSRGRNRDLKKSSSSRRSQSMSRVETVQRARLYPVASSAPRSKEEESIGLESHSDQEASEDDTSGAMPTKQRLAKFKEMEGGSRYGSEYLPKTKKVGEVEKTFKWEVKEATPLNRGGLIVHGDVPKRPTTKEVAAAAATRLSESTSEGERQSRSAFNDEDDYRDEGNRTPTDVIHGSTVTAINEDELPPPATTRNLLQHFKSMEDVTKAPPRPRPAPAIADRETTTKSRLGNNTTAASYMENNHDDHNFEHTQRSGMDLDDNYYEGSPESGDFGNDPVHNPNVIRETDQLDEEEMPATGTTRNLLAKFQSIQTKH